MSSDAMLGRRAVAGSAGGGQRGPGHWAASVMDRCADSEPVNTVSSEPARSHEQTGGGWGVCARQRLKPPRRREGSWGTAQVRTGLGKSDRPGS